VTLARVSANERARARFELLSAYECYCAASVAPALWCFVFAAVVRLQWSIRYCTSSYNMLLVLRYLS
jgi:hypothetical protein